jgi:hypothetical protein
MTELQPAAPDAWYRYPWVWFVFCIPFSAVLFGVVMFVSANNQPDDLVVDDYYKEGMGINRKLALDERARQLDARVVLTAVTGEGAVFDVPVGGDDLVLSLFHVSDSNKDLKTDLTLQSGTIQTASSAELSAALQSHGVWYLEVRSPGDWRVRQRIETPVTHVELVP